MKKNTTVIFDVICSSRKNEVRQKKLCNLSLEEKKLASQLKNARAHLSRIKQSHEEIKCVMSDLTDEIEDEVLVKRTSRSQKACEFFIHKESNDIVRAVDTTMSEWVLFDNISVPTRPPHINPLRNNVFHKEFFPLTDFEVLSFLTVTADTTMANISLIDEIMKGNDTIKVGIQELIAGYIDRKRKINSALK